MLSEFIAIKKQSKHGLTVADLLQSGGHHGFGFLLLVLAFPAALPIPAPGYGTLFGGMIVLVACQMLLGRDKPWLPEKVKAKKLNFKVDEQSRIIRWGLQLEKLIKPRWDWVFMLQSRLVGLSVLIGALVMSTPLPGTNTIPAIAIFITAMGLIRRDGLMVLLGALLNSLTLVGFVMLLLWGFSWLPS